MAKSHSGPIDLLLTDMVMPGIASPELARSLLALKPKVHVLYMSGYTDAAAFGDAGLSPGAPFLAKPFTTEKLLSTVRQALDVSKSSSP